MAEIILTKGKVAVVDNEDLPLVSRYSWYAHRWSKSGVWYAYTHITLSPKKYTHISMHSLIMPSANGMKTDHRDGDGLNNRRRNLRSCTHAENMRNRTKRASASSVYKGVGFHKRTKTWRAYILVGGKQVHLGHFLNEGDAAHAYNKAALSHFGEFARLNEVGHRE